ncbi:iron uptake porin, partial [Dolichospermum sp. ST_sed9]|nr:iron uptake porin [Dolichospermum sp. ST_sed9]
MQKLRTSLITSSTIISAILSITSGAWAETVPANNSEQQVKNNSQEQIVSQVTSVSQLSDVQPNDWAFQALQSLVERYGCIAGYPNRTYRGNRALSRYEFAAGLNACLDRVNELIATATADLTTKQDLGTIQKLQEEFSTELAILRGRIDIVEAKTAELQAHQFSTTTKLQGQVVTVVSDVLLNKQVNGADIPGKNTTLGSRARIELVSSFTGKDTLFTRIQANNINSPGINTTEGNLFFAGTTGNTTAAIDALFYAFPLSKNTQIKLIANAGAADDVTNTVNLFDGDGAFGAVSTFGTRNPIYGQLGDKGIAVNHQLGKKLALSLGYLSGTANNPTSGNGLFDGSYGALAQLTVKPSDRISLGLTYINSYKQP